MAIVRDMDFSLRFLGTEACDMDWSRYGEAGIYGSTQTLVNGTVLIDAGRTGFRSLGRFGVAPEAIEEVWFTHYHDDHYFLMCTILEDAFFHVGRIYLPDVETLLTYSDPTYMWETWYGSLTKNLSLSGSWGENAMECCASRRLWHRPNRHMRGLGFRVVLTMSEDK